MSLKYVNGYTPSNTKGKNYFYCSASFDSDGSQSEPNLLGYSDPDRSYFSAKDLARKHSKSGQLCVIYKYVYDKRDHNPNKFKPSPCFSDSSLNHNYLVPCAFEVFLNKDGVLKRNGGYKLL